MYLLSKKYRGIGCIVATTSMAFYKNDDTWNEMPVVSDDEENFLKPNQKEEDYIINQVNSLRRSIDKDVTATKKGKEENDTLREVEICPLNQNNRSLQKQLRKERHERIKEKRDLLKNSKMNAESIKKSNAEDLRKFKKEHQKETEILVADIEHLVAAVEQKDLEISKMSATIESNNTNIEMLQSEIDRLKSELVDHKQQLIDVTQLARFSRKLVRETEKESMKVLQQNEMLKFRIDELAFAAGESDDVVFPLHHQLQPHPSECDLQLDDNNNDCHGNNNEAMSVVILPDKFNPTYLLN